MKTETQQRREQYHEKQLEFDFNKEDKEAKLLWIETTIMPMLSEV